MTKYGFCAKSHSFSIDNLIRSSEPKEEHTIKNLSSIESPHKTPNTSRLSPDEDLSDCSAQVTSSDRITCSSPLSDDSGLSSSIQPDSSLDNAELTVLTRKKKARTAFTQKQIDDLERRYESQRYLSATERGDLAEELDLTDQQVKTWFQNRRMKEKRQKLERNDGPVFPTGGVDVAQLNALGISCPLPPVGHSLYSTPNSSGVEHSIHTAPYISPQMAMYQSQFPRYPLPGPYSMFHPYALPYGSQMMMPMPAFGPVR